MPTLRTRAGWAALAAVCLATLLGCTSGPTAQDPSTPPVPPASSGGASSSGSPSSPSPTPATAPTTAAAPTVFVTRKGSVDSQPVLLDVYPIQRSGGTMTLNMVVRTTVKEPNAVYMGTAMNDDNSKVSARSPWVPDGFRLIDTKNKKAYLAATVGAQLCLCEPHDPQKLTASGPVSVSITYAAPPVGLTSLDLVAPLFGTVIGVPVV